MFLFELFLSLIEYMKSPLSSKSERTDAVPSIIVGFSAAIAGDAQKHIQEKIPTHIRIITGTPLR